MTQTYAGRLVLRLPKATNQNITMSVRTITCKGLCICEYTLDLMFQLQSRGCIYTAAVSKLWIKWKNQGATVHIKSHRNRTRITLWYTKTSFVSLPHAMYSLFTVSPTKFLSFVWPCRVRTCKQSPQVNLQTQQGNLLHLSCPQTQWNFAEMLFESIVQTDQNVPKWHYE
jgi:hypothetical protein